MRKLLLILGFIAFPLLMFCQNQNYAEIVIIGYGKSKMLYLNDKPIRSFGSNEIIKYRIHSRGNIKITTYINYQNISGTIDVEENKTYYYVVGKREVIEKARINGEYISIQEADSIRDEKGGKIWYETVKESVSNSEISVLDFEWIKQNHENKRDVVYQYIEVEESLNEPIGKLPKKKNGGAKQGTCFLVDSKGYVLTNYHVVEGSEKFQIKGLGGDFNSEFEAILVAVDVDLDLALLKIKNSLIVFPDLPFGFASAQEMQGADAFTLGYPLAMVMGQEIKVTNGIISAKSGFKGSISQYQFSASVQPGNSGSPLFNEKGEVIGIVNAKLSGAEGAGYAIKSQYIVTFLNLVNQFEVSDTIISLADKNLTEKIKVLKGNIFIIRAE